MHAIDVAVYGWPSDRKWAAFENLSMTVSIMDLPLTRGKPAMKSMATSA
jgi:hypothetical protein